MPTAAPPLPPGPKGHPVTGNLVEFHRDILGFYERLAREYGDVARFRLGGRRMVLVNHPDLIEQVLVHQARSFGKLTYVLRLLVPLLGNGLLTSEGDFWLRQRRLIQPVFGKQRVAGYGGPIVEYARRRAGRWGDGQEIDVYAEMMDLALEIAAKILFDAEVAGEAGEIRAALREVMHDFLNRWGSYLPLPAWFPTAGNLRYRRSLRRLDRVLYRIIAERRAHPEAREDLLSVLLRARDEDGTRMTDRHVRDEAMTLFLAGHETTANCMGFTWYLLAQHPEVVARLRDEVNRVCGDRPPAADDVPRLTLTEHVIMESMRLYPPAYGFARVVKEDVELGGYRVPAGATVLLVQWLAHRDGRFWDNPEKFDPDRWADGLARRLPKFAYFPFGGGARLCIGNSLAMLETVLILAAMVRDVELTLVPGHPFRLRPAVTLKPEFGIKAVVHRPGGNALPAFPATSPGQPTSPAAHPSSR